MNKGQFFKKERIKNFVNINLGQSPSSESYCESENGVPFFQGVSEFGIKYPIPKIYTDSPKKMASNGSVLISVRAPVGNINIANEDCCIGRGLAALNCSNNSFLAYLLKYHKKDWEKIQKGAIFSAINKIDIEDFEVYYTNNEQEQNKIVSILDQQQELIDTYKNKLKILEEQTSFFENELLSGRLKIILNKESISYIINKGWYINDFLIKAKEQEFTKWLEKDIHTKIVFSKNTDNKKWSKSFYSNLITMMKNQKTHNMQSKDIKISGLIPVISQEKKLISGYSDDISKIISVGDEEGYIVFGDHTTIFKYITFDFITGADGVKVFKSKDENIIKTKLLFLLSKYAPIKSTGYNRHFKLLEEKEVFYPISTEEQILIISFFDSITNIKQAYIDKIKIEQEKMDYLIDELLTGKIRVL